MTILSEIPICTWPAIPSKAGALALALQYQLEHSQWLSPEKIRLAQFGQLRHVLAEAFSKITYWRDTLKQAGFESEQPFSETQFTSLPILDRLAVQGLADKLVNPSVPSSHGKVYKGSTSGSTGTPVVFYQTDLAQHFWRALTLREHLWQRRDFSGKMAVIRSNVNTRVAENWGAATARVIKTGPVCALNIRADIDEQLDWLQKQNPHYVLTHPSNLKALANRAIERGVILPQLRQLRTFGEILSDDTREQCRRAWNAEIADIYSSEEAGCIASQCEYGTYHIQSENLLVELVDDHGAACRPGEIGRVLITTLHNFAMPLIRYDIGDYAESGAECPCGRGLPVIRRIMGRVRNMIKLPDGTQHWPSFPEDRWVGIAPIQQLQVVQKSLDTIVLKVKSARELNATEVSQLIETFKLTLKFPHRITVEPIETILRNKNAKFEDFVSEIK
ncbi:MAG: hypothetical protein ABL891_02575 [Burkholderiales bacterium]